MKSNAKRTVVLVMLCFCAALMLGATTNRALYYFEDDVHRSGDRGPLVLGVRNDTLATLGGTDGDYVPFQLDEDGALWVNDVDNVLGEKTLIRSTFAGNVGAGAYLEICAASGGATAANIVEIVITQDTQNKIELVYDSDGDAHLLDTLYCASYGGLALDMSPQPHYISLDDNEDVAIRNNTAGAINMSGHVIYYNE